MGQAGGLHADPGREPGHRHGVVLRIEHRLGEQRDAAHRGLQLVADIGQEVAAHLLDAVRLRAVLDEQKHVVGAQWCHPGGDHEPALPQSVLQHELGLSDDPVAAHLTSDPEHLGVHELVPAHQPVGDRGRGVVHDPVGGVDQDAARTQHRKHLTDPRRQARCGRHHHLAPGGPV